MHIIGKDDSLIQISIWKGGDTTRKVSVAILRPKLFRSRSVYYSGSPTANIDKSLFFCYKCQVYFSCISFTAKTISTEKLNLRKTSQLSETLIFTRLLLSESMLLEDLAFLCDRLYVECSSNLFNQ